MRNLILIGESVNPWRNLATEEWLFDALGESARVFYLWQNENTVVVGRHQNAWKECRVKLLEDEGGRLARRSSGGGAVYHDLGNLNFTFIAPRADYDLRRQLNVIRRAVREFGIDTEYTGRNDLVIAADGAKFSGNAFRFSRDVGLHHGTVMVDVAMEKLGRYLAPDPGKLRAKGIDSVRSRVRNLRELNPDIAIPALREALIRAFVSEFGPAEALDAASMDADALSALEAKYASWEYRLGSALPFDAALDARFDWGGVTLEMRLKDGVVAEARVYSDAMDEALIARVAPALTGARYENQALAAALRALADPRAIEMADWLQTTDLGGHES